MICDWVTRWDLILLYTPSRKKKKKDRQLKVKLYNLHNCRACGKGRRTKLLKQNGRKSRIWLLVVKVGKRNNHRAVVQVEEPQLYHIEYIVSPEKCRLRLRGNNNSNTYLEPTEPEVKGYTYVRTSPSFFFLFLDLRGATRNWNKTISDAQQRMRC